MIRKNYASFLILFFGLICGSTAFAQAPIANNDDFQLFVPNQCQTMFLRPQDNDTGDINYDTFDLNPSQPGIQNEFQTPEGTFSFSNGYLWFAELNMTYNPPPLQTATATYTVQNFLGETSNVATITLLLKRVSTYGIPFNPSCENMGDGAIGIQLNSELNVPANIHVYKDDVEMANYPLSQEFNFIPGFFAGHYQYTITNCLGNIIQYGNPVDLYINPNINVSANGAYQDYNNDGIVNVGDIVNYQFSINNYSSTCTVNGLTLTAGGSITPTGGTIASLAPNATDATTITGYATITQDQINNGTVQNYFLIGLSDPDYSPYYSYDNVPLNITSGIKLNAFIDTNMNGIQDNGEQNYSEGKFSYQINSGAMHNVETSNGTHYLYETNPANVYQLYYNINPNNSYCGGQYTVLTSTYSGVSVSSGSGITTYNFAIATVPCNDISVNLNGYWNRPRPGFYYSNTIIYKNEGNQIIANGTLTFTKDAAVAMTNISASGYAATANGFTLDFYNLAPGESRSIAVTLQVPTIPTVNLGQLLTNTVSVTPADSFAPNNTATLIQPIVGSYDPNEITESHGGKVLVSDFTPNDYLTYTIRFENTGTAEAINIRVHDMLDTKLDETTVKMVSASHPYVLDRVGTNLNWKFDGVNLPPSVSGNEVTGHGYIIFKIKPKPGYAVGDIIPNAADIYFDFNPAIVTNTFNTQFVNNLKTADFAFNHFRYSPNPVRNKLSLSNDQAIEKVSVMSILGQSVFEKQTNELHTEIDLSGLTSGVYLVKVHSADQTKTFKIVKE